MRAPIIGLLVAVAALGCHAHTPTKSDERIVESNCADFNNGAMSEEQRNSFQRWLDSQPGHEIQVEELCE